MRVILLDGLSVRVVTVENACAETKKSFEARALKISDASGRQSVVPVVVAADEKGAYGFKLHFTPGKVPMINVTGLPSHLGFTFEEIALYADRDILMLVSPKAQRKAG